MHSNAFSKQIYGISYVIHAQNKSISFLVPSQSNSLKLKTRHFLSFGQLKTFETAHLKLTLYTKHYLAPKYVMKNGGKNIKLQIKMIIMNFEIFLKCTKLHNDLIPLLAMKNTKMQFSIMK